MYAQPLVSRLNCRYCGSQINVELNICAIYVAACRVYLLICSIFLLLECFFSIQIYKAGEQAEFSA